MAKTKILILHTSVGYGIKVTAENIFSKLRISADFEPYIKDLQKIEQGSITKFVEKFYLLILDHFSFIWGFLYNSKIVLKLILPLRKPAAKFKSRRILELLRQIQPAVVVSTQTTATGIIAYLKAKGLYRGKLIAVFSDFHLHRFWLYDEVDLYLCNIAEQAAQLRQLGIAEEKIALTGMFIADKFFSQVPKNLAKSEIGLLQSMPTVLMTSGARARQSNTEVFLKLLRSPKSFQVVVVCGRNEELKQELEAITAPGNHPVKIYGFVENMDVLMSACDVLVGKTGGPTMAEAIIKKLPMVITDARAGHEIANLEYLINHDLVEYGRIPREVVFLVEQILEGKIKRDWPYAFETIVKPKNSVALTAAINQIKPQEEGLRINQYQS